jgi:hypothetical protein
VDEVCSKACNPTPRKGATEDCTARNELRVAWTTIGGESLNVRARARNFDPIADPANGPSKRDSQIQLKPVSRRFCHVRPAYATTQYFLERILTREAAL